MPRPAIAREEIWTDYGCRGGTYLCTVRPVAGSSRTQWALGGESRHSAVIPADDDARVHVGLERVWRVVYRGGEYDEWRIIEDGRQIDGLDGHVTVTGADPLLDLGSEVLYVLQSDGVRRYSESYVGLTPAQLLGDGLDRLHARGLYTHVSLGTIEPTAVIADEIGWEYASLLEAARVVTAHPAARSELRLRRDGAAGYRLDLLRQIGAGTDPVEIRLGRNLLSYQQSRSRAELATAVLALGAQGADGRAATIAHTALSVVAVDAGASQVAVADPQTPDLPIILEDGQFVGEQLRRPDTTAPVVITASQADGQRFTLASVTGFAAGGVTEFVAGDGGELTEVALPSATVPPPAGFGRIQRIHRSSDVRGERNYARNAWFRFWPAPASAGPSGITYTGGYFARAVDPLAPAGVSALLREARWGQFEGAIAAGAISFALNGGSGLRLRADDVIVCDTEATGGAPFNTTITSVAYVAGELVYGCTPMAQALAPPQKFALPNSSGLPVTGSPGLTSIQASYQWPDVVLPAGVTTASVAAEVYAITYWNPADPSSTDPYSSAAAAARLVVQVVRQSDSALLKSYTAYAQTPRAWATLSVTNIPVPAGYVVRLRVQAQDRDTLFATAGLSAPEIPAVRWAYVGAGAEIPPTAADGRTAIPEFSHANRLFHEAQAELARRAPAPPTWSLSVADLFGIDPDRWPADRLTVGADVILRAPDIEGATTLRLVAVDQSHDDPTSTALTLGAAAGDFARAYVAAFALRR